MDKNGRLLLLDVTINEQNFILVNLYTAKTEENQVNIINELTEMLKSVYNISAKQIILGADFNLILSLYQKAKVEILYKKFYCQMIELKSTSELCVRNPKIERFTFRQNDRAGFI